MIVSPEEVKRIIAEVTAIAEPLLDAEGMELVDIEYRKEQVGWVLRLFIDKEQGITLDDCTGISRELGNLMDVKDPVPHSYHLEISSPGLNRPLKKEKDLLRFRGKKVRIKTAHPIGDRKNFVGILSDYKDGTIYVRIDQELFAIPYKEVARANLEWEF